ncbi:cation diffusion facilitator family transporter [Acetivibrio sp. MSJd-27]|jgi:cation diffusion facilitator family transporter|uniref:cation diffusion facilitator family transporter n=1 Tax=Acetivibrio sp. MSJd-27 TaxID=2841523 RepID=UPI0015ABD73E|nr:cation diffusion facilitator family transporter [Acetivibrio sp. MSJd-27]MBU5450384.1 cation diffusion facilitator family transporter [Acetivibrio sp. MSJd-27]
MKKNLAIHVSVISIVVNMILSILKLAAGIISRSGAMISDAVHTISDVFTTFIVMAGIHMSNKPSDQKHPYGHERFECVASILLSAALFAVGAGIGYEAFRKIIQGMAGQLHSPGLPALIAAIISIAVKEWMYWYTRDAALKIRSGALMADAWHHRSDALSSIGSFIGIFGARIGFPVLDPIASAVICLLIIKAAGRIFKDSIDKMVDRACDEAICKKISETALNQDGVDDVDEIKTRLFGARIYVDIEISADDQLSLEQAHNIAENVHTAVERNFEAVKHCMVHVNPKQRT